MSRSTNFTHGGKPAGPAAPPYLGAAGIRLHPRAFAPSAENAAGTLAPVARFCGHLDMSSLVLNPVAVLRTPFAEKFGVPRQSGLVPEAEGRVEFLPQFTAPEFVRGLEAFSHVWLVFGFHQNPPWTGSAVVRPPRLGGNERVGVFASRSPNRPNPLGLSLVRLIAIEPGVLRVAGMDAVDGTPVYDVKPYLPWTEAVPDARSDWAPEPPTASDAANVVVPEAIAQQLGQGTLLLLRRLLRLQLQPAYQEPTEHEYGMTVAGWNVRWRALPGGKVEVVSATRVTTEP